jgi:hypothetical protein
MNRTHLPAILILALGAAACASTPFDRHFEAGHYAEASLAFSEDSALQRSERPLFRAALAHALPASPVYQPARARALLERLLALYPKTSHLQDAAYLAALLEEIDRLENSASQSGAEVERLSRRVAELEERSRWLDAMLSRQEAQANAYRDLTERLDAELRETRAQLRALQDELNRLKEIDLKARRRSGQGSSRH